jgi:ribosomal protein L25 (general stress protein Ctc)
MMVSEISPQIVNRVSVGLDGAKAAAISQGQLERVRRIHQIEEEMAESRKLAAGNSQLTSRSLSIYGTRRESVSIELMDKVLEKMLAGEEISHNERWLVSDLVVYTKECIDELVAEEQYDLAQKWENVLRKLVILESEYAVENKRIRKAMDMQERLYGAEEILAEVEKDAKEQISHFLDVSAEDRAAMVKDHRRAVASFDEQTKEGMPPWYVKYSPEVINLREKQRSLVQTKRYDEAADMKELAEKVEEKERKEHETRYQTRRESLRKLMLRDHANMLACFDEKAENALMKLKHELEQTLVMRRKTVENTRKELDYMQSLIQTELDAEMKTSLARKKPVIYYPDTYWAPAPDTFLTEPAVGRQVLARTAPVQGSGGNRQREIAPMLRSVSTQTRERCRFLMSSED